MEDLQIISKEDFSKNSFLARLHELHDVPQQMYSRGALPVVTFDEYGRATPRILTVVGSRKYTEYAKQVTEHLIATLSGQPVIIVSGLALGIDSIAHKAALKHMLVTLAVPGSGLGENVLYPSTHRNLAQEIISSGGALLSELPPDTNASPWTFPQRNRVMAALSDAVLIIEAEEKSGTLITARQALELGRDIGAIPGNIFSPTTQGPHLLIKDGAYPITSKEDLFALLHLSDNGQQPALPADLTEHEAHILSLLREPKQKDALLLDSKLSFEDFFTAFSSLEIRGCVEDSFGEVNKVV